MNLLRLPAIATLLLVCISSGAGQSSDAQQSDSLAPSRDPQALRVLNQELIATGGNVGIGSIRDFTAAGTITYFWAGKEVSGPVKLSHRGSDQFRLDANLPTGIRSYSLNRGRGIVKDESGKSTEVPFFNTLNSDVLAYLFTAIDTALKDTSNTITYVDSVPIYSSQRAHHVRVKRRLPSENRAYASLPNLMVTDYFVDMQSGLLLKVSDKAYSIENPQKEFPHSFEFETYRNIGGVNFPMLLREKINDQDLWEIHLDSVSLNVGMTEQDFVVQ